MISTKKANILGVTYTIYDDVSEKDDGRIKNLYGCCDYSTKEILLAEEIRKAEDDSMKNLDNFYKKVLRHEIIHAYLFESGLRENSNKTIAWAENEEMVDWIAIQFPKIYETFKKLEILD